MADRCEHSKKNGSPEEVTVKVVFDMTDETPVSYVNYAEVGHSQYEFTITVVRVPTKLSPEAMASAKKTGEVRLEPQLQLLLPPRVIPGLIDALKKQLDSYEKSFGPMRAPQESGNA